MRLLTDQGISIAETLKDMRNYLDRQKYKSNDNLYEFYLRSILPGSELGDLIGTAIEPTDVTVKKLLDFKTSQTEKLLSIEFPKKELNLVGL